MAAPRVRGGGVWCASARVKLVVQQALVDLVSDVDQRVAKKVTESGLEMASCFAEETLLSYELARPFTVNGCSDRRILGTVSLGSDDQGVSVVGEDSHPVQICWP